MNYHGINNDDARWLHLPSFKYLRVTKIQSCPWIWHHFGEKLSNTGPKISLPPNTYGHFLGKRDFSIEKLQKRVGKLWRLSNLAGLAKVFSKITGIFEIFHIFAHNGGKNSEFFFIFDNIWWIFSEKTAIMNQESKISKILTIGF